MSVLPNCTQSVGAFGAARCNLIGTCTASLDIEPYPGSGDYNCAGYFGRDLREPAAKVAIHAHDQLGGSGADIAAVAAARQRKCRQYRSRIRCLTTYSMLDDIPTGRYCAGHVRKPVVREKS